MTTEIKKCECQQSKNTTGGADYQDQLYGKGNRVHNCAKNAKGDKTFKCTVCGKKS
ncbi:hypothetical protein UFOVP1138_83 [uncultured Caudovirales phage]|uniref:Uncharacterized protein n=1 Tax=uncultured Caudovirales phage TaxID=2100421 RepID=A0A6J5R0A7_9CAUD|nr:hypothetical protein UFOVP975_37 [uncultured Caudovirales phage]CAB4186335.1 hypothetical protein UFOVP1138_83 [uncultured Caudovirales phage]CAB4204465.1 hypothetical protein UFOVP1394_80 [uncultured Caudovirales phage]